MEALEADVLLTRLAYGGDAIGRLEDGRAVFVPFGLPGERVRIRLLEQREHFARGKILEVLEASPERIEPRCLHFGVCGGCHFQHLEYASQLRAKAEVLADQLRRIGHIENPPVRQTVAAGPAWNYRNHVQFHLSPQGRLGFMRATGGQTDAEVVHIRECHLPMPGINAFWPQLDLDASAGIQRLSLREGSDGELMMILEGSTDQTPELEVEAPISIAHVYDQHVVVQAGEEHIRLSVLGREFRVSPTTFFQVNLDVAEKMVEHVLSIVPETVDTLIDAYCGAGLFSAFLAPRCKRLIGIEAARAACEDFVVNLDEFENVELYEDAAERALPALDVRAEVILVDPPRTGLERTVVDALARLAPELIAYVSCDPSTLARDVARLTKGGYEIESITPFDMFPQTYHIESVSVLKKRS